MRQLILLSCLLLFPLINIDVHAQCLLGNCTEGFSVLMTKESGAEGKVKVIVGNFVTETGKHGKVKTDGITYEYTLGQRKVYNIRKLNAKPKYMPDYLAQTSDDFLSIAVLANRDDDIENGKYLLSFGGNIYKGEFKNRLPDGVGKMEYDNHHRLEKLSNDTLNLRGYIGTFTKGDPDGAGKLYYSTGDSENVIFKDGILVSPQVPKSPAFRQGCVSGNCDNGWGSYTWTHDHVYKFTGIFIDGHPALFGHYQFINGESYMGELDSMGAFNGRGVRAAYPAIQENGEYVHGEFVSGYTYDGIDYYTMTMNALTNSHHYTNDPTPPPPGKCKRCSGKGEIATGTCHSCSGRGTYRKSMGYRPSDEVVKTELHSDGTRDVYYKKQGFYNNGGGTCIKCKGTGSTFSQCPDCKGTGKERQ